MLDEVLEFNIFLRKLGFIVIPLFIGFIPLAWLFNIKNILEFLYVFIIFIV